MWQLKGVGQGSQATDSGGPILHLQTALWRQLDGGGVPWERAAVPAQHLWALGEMPDGGGREVQSIHKLWGTLRPGCVMLPKPEPACAAARTGKALSCNSRVPREEKSDFNTLLSIGAVGEINWGGSGLSRLSQLLYLPSADNQLGTWGQRRGARKDGEDSTPRPGSRGGQSKAWQQSWGKCSDSSHGGGEGPFLSQ